MRRLLWRRESPLRQLSRYRVRVFTLKGANRTWSARLGVDGVNGLYRPAAPGFSQDGRYGQARSANQLPGRRHRECRPRTCRPDADQLRRQYAAKIAALERMVGRRAPEIEFLKGRSEKRTTAEKRGYIRHYRPRGFSVAV